MYSIAASRGPPSFTRTTTHEDVDDNFANEPAQSETNNVDCASSLPMVLSSSSSSIGEARSEADENDALSNNININQTSNLSFKNKGLIEYENASDGRCTHTAVRPSTMMALAMELQVSNRGKASKMFRLGKAKTQEDDAEKYSFKEESKLTHLWVVPETDQFSKGDAPNTATHLQPSLVNSDFVLQTSLSPDTENLTWKEPPSTGEMLEEDLALLADISVADLVGNADSSIPYSKIRNEFDNASAAKENDVHISSRNVENDESCDDKLESNSFEQQLKFLDNECQIKQETVNHTKNPSKILSPVKTNLSSSSIIGADQTLSRNDMGLTTNYNIQSLEMAQLNLTRASSDESVIFITSGEANASLHGNAADSKVSTHVYDAARKSDALVTSPAVPGGQNDFECKSIVINFQEKCEESGIQIGNETVLNDTNKCKSDEGTLCESNNREKTSLRDDNNNLVIAEESRKKFERDQNIQPHQVASSQPNNIYVYRQLNSKKIAAKESLHGSIDDDTKPSPKIQTDLVVSESTLSSLSSSLVSVTSMESLSTSESSQSVLLNSLSSTNITSNDANFNSTSLEASTTCESPNYFMHSCPLTQDNQMRTSNMSNNKRIRESRPSSMNSATQSVSAECEQSFSSGTTTSENRNTQAQSTSFDNRNSVEESESGVRPLPSGGPPPDSSNNQNDPSPFCLTSSVVVYEICRSEKVSLAPRLESEPSKAVLKSELNTFESFPLALKTGENCSDFENEMAFCCYRSKKSKQKLIETNAGSENKSGQGFVQPGKDPIVESLRASKTIKLAAADGYRNEKESAKLEKNELTESVENNHKLKETLVKNQTQIVEIENTNDKSGLRDKQQLQLQENEILLQQNTSNCLSAQKSIVKCVVTETNCSNNMKNREAVYSSGNCIEVEKEIPEKTDDSPTQSASEVNTVNRNSMVTVSNDSSGSKISLKKSEVIQTDANFHNVSSTSQNVRENKPCQNNDTPDDDVINSVIVNEAITTSTSMRLQPETSAKSGQLSNIKDTTNMNHLKTVTFSDVSKNEIGHTRELLETKPPSFGPARAATTSQAVESKNEVVNPTTVIALEQQPSTVEVSNSPRGNCVISTSAGKRRVVVRTSASEPPNGRRVATIRKPINERFAATKAKYQNLIKTSSLQNISVGMEADTSRSFNSTASPKPVFSSSVFVSIGARRKKFSEAQSTTTPSRTLDSSWRLRQKNPVQSAALSSRPTSAEPSFATPRRPVYRQWSNFTASTPVEPISKPRLQSEQESVRRDTPTPRSKTSQAESSDAVDIRSRFSVRPPRSATYNRIGSSGRFEIGNSRQNSFGTRYSSHNRLNRKEMSCVGNGSVIRSGMETSALSKNVQENDNGVVEAPMLTVKEIRARYKSRDYENFAIPKTRTGSSSHSSRKGSDDFANRRTTSQSSTDHPDVFHNETNSKQQVAIDSPPMQPCTVCLGTSLGSANSLHHSGAKVAKQVMNLFKGALDFEQELSVFEKEAEKSFPTQTEHIMPLKHNGHVVIRTSSSSSSSSDHQELPKETKTVVKRSPGKLKTSTWPPAQPEVVDVEKKDIKASVQQIKSESEAVLSFDESLDQFYDVLNELTS